MEAINSYGEHIVLSHDSSLLALTNEMIFRERQGTNSLFDLMDESFGERLASEVASLIKRSKAHQFYGLMGKRSDIPKPMRVDRRRNKGETFVGLMGRRSLRG
ncbi:hypothetical protein MHYP_G00157690 [Metynnis hypsauchen]